MIQSGTFRLRFRHRGVQYHGDIFGFDHHGIGDAGEGGWGIGQHPKAGVHHPNGLYVGGLLQAGGKFLRKSAAHRRGFGVCCVPQIKSANGADLRGGGQSTEKSVSLQ